MSLIRLNLKRLSATDEWKITVSENGRFNENSSYYGSSKLDAVGTALAMSDEYEARGDTVEFGDALEKAYQWSLGSEEDSDREKNPTSRRKLDSFHRASKSRKMVKGDSEIERILKAQARELKRAGMGLSYDIRGTFAKKKKTRRKKNPYGRKIKRSIQSKAQWKFMHLLYERGAISKKVLDDLKKGVTFSKLPERKRKGNKMARRKKSRKTRRSGRKRSKAAIRRERLRNLAKARSARRSGGRRHTARRSRRRSGVRRHRNFDLGNLPAGSFVKQWFKVDGQKRKISAIQAAALRGKGHTVIKAIPPVRTGPRPKKRKKSKARRRITRAARRIRKARRSRRHGRRRSKASIRRERLRNLVKARRARRTGRRAGKRKVRRSRRRGSKARRKSRRAGRRTQRRARRHGRRRSKASIRRERLRNLAKARRVRARRAGRPARRRSRVVSRAVRQVKRRRRISAKRLRPMISRDYRSRRHRRGRGRSRRLAQDAIFSLDFRRALKQQRLGGHRLSKLVRRLRRHPSHLDKRHTTRSTRRGWREFAGTSPNLVARFASSPVNGQFNGVLIDEIHGKLANSGRAVTIKPPKNAPLYFIWTPGGRSFEVVGPLNAMTSLAKGMSRAGEPIQITKLNYLAPTYPSPAGTRRTGRERMYVAYTHTIKHKAYLSWNQKSGSSARFPLIVKGSKGQGLVNRSGILL